MHTVPELSPGKEETTQQHINMKSTRYHLPLSLKDK